MTRVWVVLGYDAAMSTATLVSVHKTEGGARVAAKAAITAARNWHGAVGTAAPHTGLFDDYDAEPRELAE